MNYIIREADIEDAKNVIEYIKIVSDETDFLISDSSERNFTVRKEKEFLKKILRERTGICIADYKMQEEGILFDESEWCMALGDLYR